jgi:hypothetical protein
MILQLDVISQQDLIELQEASYRFKADVLPNSKNNFYTRQKLKVPDWQFVDKIQQEITGRGIEMFIQSLWINEIRVEKDEESMHSDASDGTAITFINDEFSGGELECEVDGQIIRVIPKRGRTIIILNKIKHRVLPLTSGVRYTAVLFFKLKTKRLL